MISTPIAKHQYCTVAQQGWAYSLLDTRLNSDRAG